MIKEFLKDRGLELSDEKTLITHIDGGFDFLGWNLESMRASYLLNRPKNPSRNLLKKSPNTGLLINIGIPKETEIGFSQQTKKN